MSRRDTIIIAILVNAGVLLVLFALAMPPKEQISDGIAQNVVQEAAEVGMADPATRLMEGAVTTVSHDAAKGVVVDEIDQVLSEWNDKNPDAIGEQTAVAVAYPLEGVEGDHTVSSQPAAVEMELASSDKTIEVIVKKGDVLEKIAKTHGTSAKEIMKLNHLSSTKLQIGQVLKVPSTGELAKTKSKAKAAAKKAVKKSGNDYYTVKTGDNPWTIANKNHIKLEELLKLNDLNEDNAKKLKPGDKIRIK